MEFANLALKDITSTSNLSAQLFRPFATLMIRIRETVYPVTMATRLVMANAIMPTYIIV